MGLLRRIADALTMTEAHNRASAPRFSVDGSSIPPEFFGYSSYEPTVAKVPRVSRETAIQVPAVKRARDLICPPIAALPFTVLNANADDVTGGLLRQPEPDVPRSVTMTRLVEDLVFEGRAWWRITKQDYRGFPMEIRRLDPRSVDCDRGDFKVWHRKDGTVQGESWEWIPDDKIIRFDSPTDGLLNSAGARAIRTALMLDERAYRSATNPQPDGYFTPKDGVDPFDDDPDDDATDEEIAAAYTASKFLENYAAQRRTTTNAYVPGGLEFQQLSWDPKSMQLAEARQHAVLEIARATGLEPEDLGVSVTSRTYFNAETKRKDRIDFALGMFIWAIQDRLSMPDVTPRGQYVRAQLGAFLRTDTLARFDAYRQGMEMGLYSLNDVRAMEDLPPIPGGDVYRVGGVPVNQLDQAPQRGQLPAGAPAPTPEDTAVNDNVRSIAAHQTPAVGFAAEDDLIPMSVPSMGATFSVDKAKRQITGRVIPYGGAKAFSRGKWFEFSKGTVKLPADLSRIKFHVNHDLTTAMGYAIAAQDEDAGLDMTFQLDSSAEADKVLQKAADKVWDGLSAGIKQGGQFDDRDGVMFAVDTAAGEVSICSSPAFDDARVTAVALSAHSEGNTMKCTKCGRLHAAGVVECNPTHVAEFAAFMGSFTPAATAPAVPTPAAGTTAEVQLNENPQFGAEIARGITAGFQQLVASGALTTGGPGQSGQAPAREVVAAAGAGAAQFSVSEALPYRFDGLAGQHSFSEDMRDMANGDPTAKQRVDEFLVAAFAVTTANVSTLNPTRNRPELYVPQLEYMRPLFDLVSSAPIADKTPFTVPKFGSASGLVGPHVEGVEPTPGSFTTTSQTITPTAISGKVEITREVWDQGGSPQADQIIWGEMLRAYFETIEVNIAAMLNALSAATLYGGAEINLAGATDEALQDALIDLLVDLQFVRGGNRYTALALDGQLFPAIAKAKDADGRLLFPVLGAVNAAGETEGNFSEVRIGTQRGKAAWALGSANSSHSYLFVPSSVWQWVSPPRRFTFEYQVKSVDMAIWGYQAGAVLRNSDVARIDYTTADV
jgi:HK97 family phage portal protein/HK97 family phage prohead protease